MNIGKIFKNPKTLISVIVLVVAVALVVTLVLVLGGPQDTPAPQGTQAATQGTTAGTDTTDPEETTGEDATTAPTEAPAPDETQPEGTNPVAPVVTTYTVTFKDHDGKILKTQTVEKGKAATAPANPSREHFTFAGWDKSFTGVTADMVVTATYTTSKSVIYAESATVNKGAGEVTVNIRVVNNPGIMGAILKVSVDNKMFSFKAGSKTEYPGLNLTVPGPGITGSPYTFMLDAEELSANDKKDGNLFSITFKINNPNATGAFDVRLSCDNGAILDENYNEPNVAFGTGTITVK